MLLPRGRINVHAACGEKKKHKKKEQVELPRISGNNELTNNHNYE